MGETVDNEKHNNKTRTRSSEKEALGIRARNVQLFPAALLRSPINRMYLPTHAQTADRIQRRVCVDVYTPTCPEAHNGSRLLVQQPRIYPLLSTVCTRPSASTYTSTWSRNIYIYMYIYKCTKTQKIRSDIRFHSRCSLDIKAFNIAKRIDISWTSGFSTSCYSTTKNNVSYVVHSVSSKLILDERRTRFTSNDSLYIFFIQKPKKPR